MNCPESLVLYVTAAAIAVSEKLTDEDIALLSAMAMQFGDTLTTIAATKDKKRNQIINPPIFPKT